MGEQVSTGLAVGDWKLLYILATNMEPLIFGELVLELAQQMKDSNHNVDAQQKDAMITQI